MKRLPLLRLLYTLFICCIINSCSQPNNLVDTNIITPESIKDYKFNLSISGFIYYTQEYENSYDKPEKNITKKNYYNIDVSFTNYTKLDYHPPRRVPEQIENDTIFFHYQHVYLTTEGKARIFFWDLKEIQVLFNKNEKKIDHLSYIANYHSDKSHPYSSSRDQVDVIISFKDLPYEIVDSTIICSINSDNFLSHLTYFYKYSESKWNSRVNNQEIGSRATSILLKDHPFEIDSDGYLKFEMKP